MPITVSIPTPLRNLTKNQDTILANGTNVAEVIKDLEAQFPGIGERLLDATGEIRRFVNFYLNGEDIRFLQNQATPVKDSDEISIVPAIAGG